MATVVSNRSRRGALDPIKGFRRGFVGLVSLALLFVAPSCGEAEARVDAARVERLLLEPADGFETARPVERRALGMPDDPATWLRGGSAARIEFEDEGTGSDLLGCLRMAPGRETRLRVPITAGSGGLDGVMLEVLARSSCEVLIRTHGEGDSLEHRRIVHKDDLPQVLDFEWPALAASPRTVEALELRFLFARQPVDLLGVELVHRTADGWLPKVEEGADWIEFEGDARRGLGLRRGRPLRSEFAAGEGGRLRFDVAAHPAGETSEGTALVVEISDGLRVPELRRVELPAVRVGERRRWTAVDLDLGTWSGLEVDVRFRVDGTGIVALANARVAPAVEAPPTVVLITSDTHRFDHLGSSSGAIEIETPFLDALAAQGTRFTGVHATTNVTLPSHATILTGLSPRDHGAIDNRTGLSTRARTLAEAFRDAGYATYGLIAASHLRNEHSGLGQGFDRFSTVHDGEVPIDASIERLLGWLPDASDRPLFVWLHAYDAHAPYDPPEYFRPKLQGRDPFDPDRPALTVPPPLGMATLRDPAWADACYRGEVEALDDHLGALLEHPRLLDGVVAFTADHGECLGHPQVGWGHPAIFPGILRVPMILRYPGGERGRSLDGLRDHTSLGRTLLDLSGLEETPFPGRSLLARSQPEDPAVFALSSAGFEASIRRGDELLVLSLEGKRQAADPRPAPARHGHVLYDLAADPEGSRDLSSERPESAAILRRDLIEWLAAAEDAGWARSPSADAETLAELEAMGYLDAGKPKSQDADDGSEFGSWIELDCGCDACAAGRSDLSR